MCTAPFFELIDGTRTGNIARLINHSCNPNTVARVVAGRPTPQIVFFATRAIRAGEELTLDYEFEREPGEKKIPCRCGTSNCRGVLN